MCPFCVARGVRLAGLLFTTLFLSGCAHSPVESVGAAELSFSLPARGARDGSDVDWTLWIQNTGSADSPATTLTVQLQFYQRGQPVGTADRATAIVDGIPIGDTRVAHVRTPFRGTGDYSGSAQLAAGAATPIQQELFFEVCGGIC